MLLPRHTWSTMMERNYKNFIAKAVSVALTILVGFVQTRIVVDCIGSESYGFYSLSTDFVNYAMIISIALNPSFFILSSSFFAASNVPSFVNVAVLNSYILASFKRVKQCYSFVIGINSFNGRSIQHKQSNKCSGFIGE